MNEITVPIQSTRTLIKASIAAILIATVIFVTIILPSEYNTDPTGVGKWLGLTVLAKEINVPTIPAQEPVIGYQENQVTIEVPANSGVEYKFKLQQYANITYEWSSQGNSIYFDFHGEPKGDTTGYFESYTIATAAEVQGSMTVPFDGVHGWYWKNISDKGITITLKTQGHYQVVGLLH